MQTISETHTLNKQQTANPHLVFYELFDYAHLSQLKEHLWFWLRLTITNGYTKKYYRYNDRDRIISLYEHLEKLLEASHIIYWDKKDELRKLHHQLLQEELGDEEESEIGPTCKTAKTITKNHSSSITQYIIETLQPAFIFHLGTVYPTTNHKLQTLNYFLILMPHNTTRPMHEWESLLQNKYEGVIVPIVKSVREAARLRKKGNPFFITSCTEGKMIYQREGSELEASSQINKEESISFSGLQLSIAESFFRGSKLFFEIENYTLSTFMLHQAAEGALSATLYFTTGYREQTHNLNRQLTLCKLWLPQVASLLDVTTEEEQKTFRLLQHSYHSSRYNPGFIVTKEQTEWLQEKITLLLKEAKTVITRDSSLRSE
jgi:HEPN domain-containing protein